MTDIPWGLVAFVAGVAYGYLSPGRTQTALLLPWAAAGAVVVALLLALVGWSFRSNPLGFGAGLGAFAVATLVLVLVFLAGAWLGDRLERRRDARRTDA